MNSGTAERARSGQGVGILAILFVTWGTVFLDRMSQLYLAPYIAPDLHIDNEQVGFLAAVTGVCWAVSTLAFGAWSDRIGRRVILIPAIFAFSLLSWLSGMVHSFDQMLIVRGLLGFAEGPCWSLITALVEESSTARHRGRNVGIVVSAASLVGLAVAPVLSTQIAAHYGWRAAFFVAGIPGILCGILVWRYVPEPIRRESFTRIAGFADYIGVFAFRNMWLTCAAAIGVITWLFQVNVFVPLFITQVMHQPGTTAGFLLGATGIGSFFSGFIMPAVSDRIGRRRALLIMSVSLAIVPLAFLTPSLYGHLWLLAAIVFVANMQQAIVALVMVLIPSETVSPRVAGTAIGLATFCAEAIGATCAPAIGGHFAQLYGLSVPLWIAVGGAAVIFVAALFMEEPRRGEAAVVVPVL